jgi:hypothetical protein
MKQKYNLPSNKKFGFFFSFIFFVLSAYFLHFNTQIILGIVFIILSLVFILLAFFHSEKLSLFNWFWFKFGLILGKIVSPIVCGLIYFLIILPFGFFFKLKMLLVKKNNQGTFWKMTIVEKYDINYFKRQY